MSSINFPDNPVLDQIWPTEGAKRWKWNGVGWAIHTGQSATDSQLRNRSTHTGTQAIATIEGLEAELAEKLESVSSETISDATAVGKALITTANAGAALATLGAASALSVSDIVEDMGNLANLNTTHKNTVVGAINEVRGAGAPQWENISGKPPYIASGYTVAMARSSIGTTSSENGTHTGTTTFQVVAPNSINETAVALGAGVNIDLSAGSYFSKTITTTTTFTRSNVPPIGRVGSFTLELTNGGNFTVTWFAGVKWDGGTQPALTANGIDILAFITRDGGTTWRGILNSKDSK